MLLWKATANTFNTSWRLLCIRSQFTAFSNISSWIKIQEFYFPFGGQFLKLPYNHCSTVSQRQMSQYKSQPDRNSTDMGRLLYIGQDKQKLKYVLGSFYLLSGIVAAASPYLLSLTHTSKIATGFLCFQIFVFVVLNPLGLYQFGKRYVNQLYYKQDTDTYTAVMLSPVVVTDKRLTFSPRDCKMPANPSVFTSFYVKKHPLFINSDTMNYSDYMHMLRYASDLDYENPERQKDYSDAIKKAVDEKKKQQNP